jgi:hypothetical protein
VKSNVYITTGGDILLNGENGIPASFPGNYYITVRHRNSIETTTAYPVSFADNTIFYQFDGLSRAFGENLREILPGTYALYGGDVNQDGIVDSGDMISTDNSSSTFAMGYLPEDITGDGLVDSSDMIVIGNNSALFISKVVP